MESVARLHEASGDVAALLAEVGGNGLLARQLFHFVESGAGRQRMLDPSISPQQAQIYREHLVALLNLIDDVGRIATSYAETLASGGNLDRLKISADAWRARTDASALQNLCD